MIKAMIRNSNAGYRIALALLTLVVTDQALASPDNTTADAVLGQLSFTVNGANEGGNPSAASLNGNRGLVVDRASGRIWVCDTSNNRVLSWPSAAGFTDHQSADIVLGQADFTSNGDNRGLAAPTASTLSGPRSAAVDSAGRLYVADSGNKRILRYDPPIVSNQAAVQVFGQAGSFTTANQAAANAATADNLGNPDGIAVDSQGNVYLADLFLHRVLIYNTPATTDTTADRVIGQPNLTSAQRNQNDGAPVPAANTLNNPEGVAVDDNGNLYVVDQGNNRVLRYSAPITTNQAATIVYGQPNFTTDTAGTTDSKMNVPVAAAIDPVSGNLYVADSINNRMLEFVNPANDGTADRVFGQTLFTTGTPNLGGISATSLLDVGGVALDAQGNLYAGDRLNNRLLRYNVGTTGGGGMNGGICGLPCGAGFFSVLPMMLLQTMIMKRRMRRKGSMHSARRNTSTSISITFLAVAVLLTTTSSLLASPENTTADAVLGQLSFAVNAANEGGNASAASLNGNRGLTVDRNSGRLWVCDTSNNRVLSWPSAASFSNHQSADIVLGQADFTDAQENKGGANPNETTLSGPRDIAVDSSGRVYVADSGNKRILRYDPPIATNQAAVQVFGQNGSFTTANQAAGNAANANNLGNPDGIAVDAQGNVYLADLFLHRVLIFDTPATTDTTADRVLGQPNLTSAQRNQNDNNPVPAANTLNNPEGVEVDDNGNVYVVDQSNNRVLRFTAPITTNQNATRVYGQADFTGGNAATTQTGLSVPVAAAIDPVSGSLYVADSINDRVLEFADPANDSTADRVLGQLDFTSGTQNVGGVSATTLFDVGGVAVDAQGNLYAGDRLNNRVLRYNIAPDGDADGVPDATDNCPTTANANQANNDGDAVGDACDGCPNDATKTAAGVCGCGTADTDTDADGVADCNDNCDNAANADQADADADGIGDVCDNCINTANADQADADADGVGDACEPSGGGGVGGGGGPIGGICGLPCGAGFFQLLPLMALQSILMRRRRRR